MGRASKASKGSKATVVAESPAAPAPPTALRNATHLENVMEAKQEGPKVRPQSFAHFFGENFPATAVLRPKRHSSGERRAAEHVPEWCDEGRPDDLVDVLNAANQTFEDKKAARQAKAREDPSDDWLRDIAEETGPQMEAAMRKGGFLAYVQTFIEGARAEGERDDVPYDPIDPVQRIGRLKVMFKEYQLLDQEEKDKWAEKSVQQTVARAAAEVIAGKKKNPFNPKAAPDVTEGGQLDASAKGPRRRKPDGWHYVPPPDKSRSRRGKGGVTKEQQFLEENARAADLYRQWEDEDEEQATKAKEGEQPEAEVAEEEPQKGKKKRKQQQQQTEENTGTEVLKGAAAKKRKQQKETAPAAAPGDAGAGPSNAKGAGLKAKSKDQLFDACRAVAAAEGKGTTKGAKGAAAAAGEEGAAAAAGVKKGSKKVAGDAKGKKTAAAGKKGKQVVEEEEGEAEDSSSDEEEVVEAGTKRVKEPQPWEDDDMSSDEEPSEEEQEPSDEEEEEEPVKPPAKASKKAAAAAAATAAAAAAAKKAAAGSKAKAAAAKSAGAPDKAKPAGQGVGPSAKKGRGSKQVVDEIDLAEEEAAQDKEAAAVPAKANKQKIASQGAKKAAGRGGTEAGKKKGAAKDVGGTEDGADVGALGDGPSQEKPAITKDTTKAAKASAEAAAATAAGGAKSRGGVKRGRKAAVEEDADDGKGVKQVKEGQKGAAAAGREASPPEPATSDAVGCSPAVTGNKRLMVALEKEIFSNTRRSRFGGKSPGPQSPTAAAAAGGAGADKPTQEAPQGAAKGRRGAR